MYELLKYKRTKTIVTHFNNYMESIIIIMIKKKGNIDSKLGLCLCISSTFIYIP